MDCQLSDNLINNNALPSDVESEKALLSLCLKNSSLLNDIVGKTLSKEDFFDVRNMLIYEAITEIYLNGESVDQFTVCNKLTSTGKLVKAGGNRYVMSLPEVFSIAANVNEYMGIVREKSILRQLAKAFDEFTRLSISSQSKANDIVDLAVGRLSNMREAPDGIGFEALSTILTRNLNQIYAVTSGKETIDAIPTGFRGIDYMLGGLRPGTLNIIAARPGMGKTALVINMATNIAQNYNKNVNIFSLEMSKSEIGNRIFASRTSTSAKTLQRAKIKREDELELGRAYKVLAPLPIYIDDNSNVNPVTMLAKCKELKAEGRLGLVILDYLQLMTMPGKGNNSSRQQEISDISRSLKIMAKELNVPVIALSQLSRGSEKRDDHTPMLSDLRDSGAIEQDADSVLFIDRNDYYRKGEEMKSEPVTEAKIIIAKNRHGETGTVKLKWMGARTLFFEEDRYSDPVEPAQSESQNIAKESAYTRTTSAGAAASDYHFDVDREPSASYVDIEEPPFDMNESDNDEPINDENSEFFGGDTNTDFPEGMI